MSAPAPVKFRKIIHIDMDAFYASVEQRDFPEYRGKPLAVGGSPSGRGVVATASYEARKFGVRSAMSSRKAMQLCPDIVFVYPRFEVYKAVSAKIREIFYRYTDLIEPLSLDEAYLDVTEDKLQIGSALEIAAQIKKAIKDELNLTASAGISINKFVAKIASDINKPDGLTFIGPSKVENFINNLPVEKFFGVGKVTAEKMKNMQLFTGADLKKLTEDELVKHFGKTGHFYYKIVRGMDDREVQTHRETKSLGAEDTFQYDLENLEEMYKELDRIAVTVHNRLVKKQLKGRTVTLKIKFSDFTQITRNHSFNNPVGDLDTIIETVRQLLEKVNFEEKTVRLLGISLSNFGEPEIRSRKPRDPEQLELFT
ncbi:DNA polymerase IV [Dyadobacter sediminis]|uniref:DNA polymerase IV n=1 Tax=Dyadobacter sediminis TaxID=1493691 RepID=A0A5R9KIZ6_9BACT|nr:DNA polymerase IV [Dyadobacter sediminis]TLU96191.1 DNA polymerase IV [Dyadobacter sediminis]GGB80045.1 DNA polymerase IV [Dyadobacter sediminis]